jgi:hypothetical protein
VVTLPAYYSRPHKSATAQVNTRCTLGPPTTGLVPKRRRIFHVRDPVLTQGPCTTRKIDPALETTQAPRTGAVRTARRQKIKRASRTGSLALVHGRRAPRDITWGDSGKGENHFSSLFSVPLPSPHTGTGIFFFPGHAHNIIEGEL